jgi:hypothetical protein
MFGRKQRYHPPDQPFAHADDCRIMRADRNVQIPWSEDEGGLWIRQCVCNKEYWRAPQPSPVRNDPLDPKTSRHAGECEFVEETEPSVLRYVLKVKDGAGGNYWWVECSACNTAWQVMYDAPVNV